jgi:CBS domain-containing protein
MVRKIVPDIVSGQDVLALPATASVREAVQGMAMRKVNSLLVVDGETLSGIFTGTDLIRKVIAAGLDPDKTPVGVAMTANPQTVAPHHSAIEALHRMHDGRFRHLPVVDGDGKVVGVVSRRDFLGYEEDVVENQEKLWEEM